LREDKKSDFQSNAQKLESVGKVSELCVTDIYSDFVKSFNIQRGQNRQFINDEIGGARGVKCC